MENLLHYYNTRIAGLVGALFLWIYFVPNTLEPQLHSIFGPHPLVGYFDYVITSRVAIVLMFAGGELLIRKWLWRLERRHFNFSGEWEGQTTYSRVWLNETGQALVPYESKHNVNMEQDCLSFQLSPTTGSEYVNWGSFAANLIDKDTIRYAYWVRYSNLERFPPEVKGYEEMNVMRRNWYGRPEMLTGIFYHCIQDIGPIYSGRVVFKRGPSRLKRSLTWVKSKRRKSAAKPEPERKPEETDTTSNSGRQIMSPFSRNIVILGISSDIGTALARTVAADENYRLLLVSRRPEAEMLKLLEESGLNSLLNSPRARFLHDVDLTNEDSLRRLREAAQEYFSEPFSVVHSVGEFWYHKRLIDMNFSEVRSMVESHLLTFAGAAYALVPVLINKGGGRLVAFSCNSVIYNYPDMAPFTSSKAGIETFVKCLAHEYAEHRIATTALALPTILTKKVEAGKEISEPMNYVTTEELSDILLNQVLTLPVTVNGNVIKVYKYNPSFYNSGYFQRNPRESKAESELPEVTAR